MHCPGLGTGSLLHTVEPPIKDTIDRNNKGQGSMYQMVDNLSTKDKMGRKQWVPSVSVIWRFHCIYIIGGRGVVERESEIKPRPREVEPWLTCLKLIITISYSWASSGSCDFR